jgi:hypothetical protein
VTKIKCFLLTTSLLIGQAASASPTAEVDGLCLQYYSELYAGDSQLKFEMINDEIVSSEAPMLKLRREQATAAARKAIRFMDKKLGLDTERTAIKGRFVMQLGRLHGIRMIGNAYGEPGEDNSVRFYFMIHTPKAEPKLIVADDMGDGMSGAVAYFVCEPEA